MFRQSNHNHRTDDDTARQPARLLELTRIVITGLTEEERKAFAAQASPSKDTYHRQPLTEKRRNEDHIMKT
jgi:hypothetical protein